MLIPHRTPLSRGEMELMEVVWDRREVAAIEVQEILAKRRNVTRATVRTMLVRMEHKGWLKHRVIGQTFFYSAVVERDEGLSQWLFETIDRLCGGKVERLLNAFLLHRQLTCDELERIRDMLDANDPRTQSRRKRRP
jgi:predicted transcriptional regulator